MTLKVQKLYNIAINISNAKVTMPVKTNDQKSVK